ncbi:hypothetical protein KKG63_03165 [Patescibacteria group bacterium]|nr:hypothetical protein [Patescibacteria group bacterium]
MDHVAILRKASFKKGEHILADILAGRKTIESRWYVHKIAPWDRIHSDDTVYFKESGCPITAKARVAQVLQYVDLDQNKVAEIVKKYGKQIDPNISEEEFLLWIKNHSQKKYCILIFLTDVTKIPPFKIDKTGFGSAAAWLVLWDIKEKLITKKKNGT